MLKLCNHQRQLLLGMVATACLGTLAIWPALAQKNPPQAPTSLKPGSAPWNYVFDPKPTQIPALAASRTALNAQGVFQRNMPSTVLIVNGPSIGSGVIIDQSGLILTNDHVVRGGESSLGDSVSTKVVIIFANRKQVLPATVLRTNFAYDTALLKLDQPLPANFKPAPVCFRNATRPGQRVFILGNPAGYDFSISQAMVSSTPLDWTLNMAKLSAFVQVPPTRLLQVDGFINGGNSGGPVINQFGEVVAIVSFGAIAEDRLNYTIPISSALNSVKVSVVPPGGAVTACGNPR